MRARNGMETSEMRENQGRDRDINKGVKGGHRRGIAGDAGMREMTRKRRT